MSFSFDGRKAKVVLNGVHHAIVEVDMGSRCPDGTQSTMFGVLVKKSGKLWRKHLYYGWSDISFVQDRFDKLELAKGVRP